MSDRGRVEGKRISGSTGKVPPSPRPPPPSPSPSPSPSPDGVHRACTGNFAHFPFCNDSMPLEQRVSDLVQRIKITDKPKLMTARHSSPIEELGVPAYDWGVNSIHGDQVSCGTNCATNYPLPVAVGASFNMTMVESLARMMGIELRALRLEHSCEKHVSMTAAYSKRAAANRADAPSSSSTASSSPSPPPPPDACIGLDTWAPNININRDPRWGRNWEVASEDPLLSGRIGEAYAKGFQTQADVDPNHLLGIITLKHWAGYNVEADRMGFDDKVPPYDMADTYLPAFRKAVKDGKAAGVMCSYNAINGVPTCASTALNTLLRGTWGFDGYITSDSGAIRAIYADHHYTKTPENATALALEAGCDINSGSVYSDAARTGVLNPLSPLHNVSLVDAALANAFRVRMRLGLFDPLSKQPFEKYGPDMVGSIEHRALSADASRQGITLLTNNPLQSASRAASPAAAAAAAAAAAVLPLSKGKKLLVVGPNADTKTMMAGGTGGGLLSALVVCKCAQNATDWCCISSPVEAIAASNAGGSVVHLPGCSISGNGNNHNDTREIAAAVQAAKTGSFDAVVFVIGGDWSVEKEGMDRTNIDLPGKQAALVAAVGAAAGPSVPLVSVMVHGGSMDISAILNSTHSVLSAFYPGVYGAQAIADVLFGDHNPGGKTPYTWYKSSYIQNVSMDDFQMANPPGRSYRYLNPTNPDILIPFAHGLSYTTFGLGWPPVGPSTVATQHQEHQHEHRQPSSPPPTAVLPNSYGSATVTFTVTVTNTGAVAGAETVFGYWTPPSSLQTNPVDPSFMPLQKQLFDFGKVLLAPGASADVVLTLSVDALVVIDAAGSRVSTPGLYAISIDTGANTQVLNSAVRLQGAVRVLERLPAGL